MMVSTFPNIFISPVSIIFMIFSIFIVSFILSHQKRFVYSKSERLFLFYASIPNYNIYYHNIVTKYI